MENQTVYKLSSWVGNLTINDKSFTSLNKSQFTNSSIFDLLSLPDLFLCYTVSIILKDSNNSYYLSSFTISGNSFNIDDVVYSIIDMTNSGSQTLGVVYMHVLNFLFSRDGKLQFKMNSATGNAKTFTIIRVNVVLNYAIKNA